MFNVTLKLLARLWTFCHQWRLFSAEVPKSALKGGRQAGRQLPGGDLSDPSDDESDETAAVTRQQWRPAQRSATSVVDQQLLMSVHDEGMSLTSAAHPPPFYMVASACATRGGVTPRAAGSGRARGWAGARPTGAAAGAGLDQSCKTRFIMALLDDLVANVSTSSTVRSAMQHCLSHLIKVQKERMNYRDSRGTLDVFAVYATSASSCRARAGRIPHRAVIRIALSTARAAVSLLGRLLSCSLGLF